MHRLNIGHMLFGKPLETKDLAHQSISKPVGLAVFASDALSSTAYATEEILIILAMAGGGAALFGLSLPLAIAIAVLLVVVTISYRQTIYAYPNGGGAYIVARDNLGELPAQIAGAALLTDYILTVAVSISAGVAQITSAFPSLYDFRVFIAVSVITLMTVVNLRGVKESGRVFAVPTYFFLGMMFLTLAIGALQYFTGSLGTVQFAHDIQHNVAEPLGLFLILRAFSSGCTALTGIEAISNGITAFEKPRSKNAAITLVWMSSILIVLFLGITLIANAIQAQPIHVAETFVLADGTTEVIKPETVISQIGRTIYGEGSPMYFLVLAGTALILLMAANTSYADFPRLAALHAGDGFLPRQLTYRGGRLVFAWGIVVLAVTASLLVIITGAETTRLIPLYAIGVFLSFTISQTGMVVRLWKTGKWMREGKLKPGEPIAGLETEIHHDPHWRQHLAVSAFGGLCTFVVMMVFAITKFATGAWFIIILVPVLVWTFFGIHHHYKRVAHALSMEGVKPDMETRSVRTVILIDDVHAETVRMVNFAKSQGHPWQAIHVGVNPEKAEKVKQKWDERIGEGELVILPSPFRLLAEPIQEHILKLQAEQPGCFVHVIMGHLVMDSFWEQALHQNSAFIFNLSLSRLERVVVTNVPYQIHAAAAH
ncbi:MAG: APC family permease [Anaerolineae bacterium]|jgi:amino acid transporter|nr:APC family permease [Anaerolineae bacterium]